MSKKTLENFLPTLPVFKENDFSLISPIWETHCHLDMLKETYVDELILKLNAIGVEKVTTIATSKKNFQKFVILQISLNRFILPLGPTLMRPKILAKATLNLLKTNLMKRKSLLPSVK